MQNSTETIKKYIHELYNSLKNRDDPSPELLDITDVLLQVYTKLDKAKYPERLVNRLVNYIRSVAFAGRIHFPPNEEKIVMKLGYFGQRAGINCINRGDYSDKSQFYSYFDDIKMPINK